MTATHKVDGVEIDVTASSSLGKEINALVAKRAKIKKLDAQITLLKKDFAEGEKTVRQLLKASKTESARSSKATATLTKREVAKMDDYSKFAAYVYKHKALDLLQSRISITALRERNASGKKVPGVVVDTLPTLSLTIRSK